MSIPNGSRIHLELITPGHQARRLAYAVGVLIHNAVDASARKDVPDYTKELLKQDCYDTLREIWQLLDEEFDDGH